MNAVKTILVLSCSLVWSVTTGQLRFTNEMHSLHKAIEQKFLISGKNYYREHVEKEKNERPVSFLWPLCGLIQSANEMELVSGVKGEFNRVLEIIGQYYDDRPPAPGYASYPPPYGGGDRFYDDNQWIGIALLDAWSRTSDSQYLSKGKMIYRFMMTAWDTATGGGLYWEEGNLKTKNTCSNGPGILLAMQLHKATGDKIYLDTAILLYDWVNRHLQAPDALYFDNIGIANHRIDHRKFSYNTGTMLQSALWLYEATGKAEYLKNAQRIADASLHYFYSTGKFRDNYWFNAVMLRAYQHLLKHSKDLKYLQAFAACTRHALGKEKRADGLMGKEKAAADLVSQSGMLEILARLAFLEKQFKF
ncbi:glycosyl hydrolase family 76 [Pseudobacter ginsenosidimutans]|uniref:Glycosyl hydrolase family 76 n=2 Tax=Pseudobacter ginsenosidimutans TaxID=661488 RepID=A0A4Q7MQQ1_9BACT|nr:glycosyl hydrolase family 76 [Pseudobacter ginsenosidimutans]